MLEETPSWTLTSYLQLGENYCGLTGAASVQRKRDTVIISSVSMPRRQRMQMMQEQDPGFRTASCYEYAAIPSLSLLTVTQWDARPVVCFASYAGWYGVLQLVLIRAVNENSKILQSQVKALVGL